MGGVADNDSVNVEALLSHGAICHRTNLYCLLMLHPAPCVFYASAYMHLCVGVNMLNY